MKATTKKTTIIEMEEEDSDRLKSILVNILTSKELSRVLTDKGLDNDVDFLDDFQALLPAM